MSRYDAIYESIVEKLNNGEITLEEAQELNEIAFEKYEDTEEDSVTLEEAMDIIGGYLMEADSQYVPSIRSSLENLKKATQSYNLTKDEAKNMRKITKGQFKKMDSIPKVKHNPDKLRKVTSGISRDIKDFRNVTAKHDMLQKLNDQGRIAGRTIGGKYKVLDKDKQNVIKKVSPKSVHESVDELRLQVYEAFESGLIEESTKDLFLTYLDLENYE